MGIFIKNINLNRDPVGISNDQTYLNEFILSLHIHAQSFKFVKYLIIFSQNEITCNSSVSYIRLDKKLIIWDLYTLTHTDTHINRHHTHLNLSKNSILFT